MHTTRISTDQQLAQLAEQWNCLTGGIPFRSWQWLYSWWQYFSKDRELFVLAVRDDRGSLVGIAPWFRENCRTRGRVLRFLGSGDVCSDYLAILSTKEHEDAVAVAVSQWLTAAADGSGDREHDRWDLLEMEGVAATDPAMARLAVHLTDKGCRVHRRHSQNCWRINLPETWEDYLSRLSRSRAKQARRLQRHVHRGDRALVRTVRDEQDLLRGMEILADLHQRRRQSLDQAGCFACDRFAGFLHEAARQLLDAGQLCLCWLELDGHPVAVDFNLATAEATFAYQSGVDPDALSHSPGNLLMLTEIRNAIQQGHRIYDFLRGDETYKACWDAEPIPLVKLRAVPNRTVPQIRHGVWLAGITMKDWLRNGLASSGMR